MKEKISLFSSKREWGIFLICALLCLGFNLWQSKRWLQNYLAKGKQEISAVVLNQYIKNNHWVLKLRSSEGKIFYTTSKEDLKDLKHRQVLLYGKPLECSFWQSLKSCFFLSFSIALKKQSAWQKPLYDWVELQHSVPLMSAFYQTLFFATTLPQEWREVANALQISHLIAISGLHLGILWAVIYAILYFPYLVMQRRYFTYRHRYFDLGVIALCVLAVYLWVLEFQPSFLRSFVMCAVALWFGYWNLRLLSYAFLAFCMIVILAMFPHLLLSVGFWFSCLGVLCILEFFHHFRFDFDSKWKQIICIAVGLNAVLFFLMMPVVFYFFPFFSPYGILSIPLSVIFPAVFVFVIVMHLLGNGGVLDEFLMWVLEEKMELMIYQTPLWVVGIEGILILLGMRYRFAFCLGVLVGVLFWLVGIFKFCFGE